LTEHVLALVGVCAIVYYGFFDISRMTSGSMSPTLKGNNLSDGDLILTEKVSYWFRKPRRWEVVTFHGNDGTQIMKRVVGLPGETVRMLKGGRLFIDGEEIHPPEDLAFLKYLPLGNLFADNLVRCADGYYVLGDDSRDSQDSRYEGPVLPGQLIGRAWYILAPSSHRGFVNP